MITVLVQIHLKYYIYAFLNVKFIHSLIVLKKILYLHNLKKDFYMFKYPEDITFTTMTRKSRIEDTWFGGNFAAAPRIPDPDHPEYSGA
jgi:hypothetical protein